VPFKLTLTCDGEGPRRGGRALAAAVAAIPGLLSKATVPGSGQEIVRDEEIELALLILKYGIL